MKYIPAFLVLLAISAAAQAALPDEPGPAPYVPGEVIVRYQSVGAVAAGAQTDGTGPRKSVVPDVHQRLRDMGLRVRRSLLDGRADLMALPSPMDVPGALRALADDPDVEYAEPNYLRYPLQTAPNDQFFGQLWGLRNTGQANFVAGGSPGVPGGDLNMAPAWDPSDDGTFPRVGDASVIVAIIDEAFDTEHPDLADNFIAGHDLANNDSNPNPDSGSQEHGTLVAGSLGAIGNNGIGVAGTTWRSSLMPLKVGIAGQDGLSSAAIMDAIEYAHENGAHIINASFGGPSFSTSERDLICGLANDNILFVSSAGNDDANLDFGRIGYPALYDCPNVVAAAATNRQDNIASFSMYGPLTTHVAAPGLQIVTTAINDDYATAQSNGVSGTSFSAPYISGIAALLRAHVPTTDEREIKARLIESGTAVPGANSDRRVSGGRVDAAAALEMAPRPSLTIEEVAIENGADRLNPGEAVDLRVTLANGWLDATGVTGTLSAEGPVTVTSGPTSFGAGFIPRDGSADAIFQAQVSSLAQGHNYVSFRLDIQADGGYAASRHFIREVAALEHDGVIRSEPFHDNPGTVALESSLYDEFHTWHVHVDAGEPPDADGPNTLIVRTRTPNDTDIDLLGRAETPPQYLITLNVNPNIPSARNFFCTDSSFDCRDPNTRVSGRSDGHEAVTHVFDGAAAPEDFYFTIVNFAQAAFDYEIWSELRAGDLRPSGICPGSEELCRPDSNTLTVGGLSSGADTFVYIQRGEYSVNGAPFTENDGAAGNGDVIRVRATGASDAELTVGGISARFTPGSGPPPDPGDDDGDDDTTGMFENGGGGGGCVRTGSGQFDPLLHLLVLLAGLVLLRLPLSF